MSRSCRVTSPFSERVGWLPRVWEDARTASRYRDKAALRTSDQSAGVGPSPHHRDTRLGRGEALRRSDRAFRHRRHRVGASGNHQGPGPCVRLGGTHAGGDAAKPKPSASDPSVSGVGRSTSQPALMSVFLFQPSNYEPEQSAPCGCGRLHLCALSVGEGPLSSSLDASASRRIAFIDRKGLESRRATPMPTSRLHRDWGSAPRSQCQLCRTCGAPLAPRGPLGSIPALNASRGCGRQRLACEHVARSSGGRWWSHTEPAMRRSDWPYSISNNACAWRYDE